MAGDHEGPAVPADDDVLRLTTTTTTAGQRFHLVANGPVMVSLSLSIDDAGSPTAELAVECAEGGEFELEGCVEEVTEEDSADDDEDFDDLDETDLDETVDNDDVEPTEQPDGDGEPAPATLVDPAAPPDGELPDDAEPTEQPEGDGTDADDGTDDS